MWKILAIASVCIVGLFSGSVDAAECCAGYTDVWGKYHETLLCEDYCCLNVDLGKYLACCSNIDWRAPQLQRNDECLESWLNEHIWVPIVGGIVFLVIIVGLCVCCCCCCGCCRRNPAPVVIHYPGGGPQTTVAMQSQTTVPAPQNPVHYGYDQ